MNVENSVQQGLLRIYKPVFLEQCLDQRPNFVVVMSWHLWKQTARKNFTCYYTLIFITEGLRWQRILMSLLIRPQEKVDTQRILHSATVSALRPREKYDTQRILHNATVSAIRPREKHDTQRILQCLIHLRS